MFPYLVYKPGGIDCQSNAKEYYSLTNPLSSGPRTGPRNGLNV